MTDAAVAAPISPYKGLAAFDDTDLDALLFFGRERDTEVLTANLLSSRLTVLYGPAGVGKSSILRAGVARRLRETAPDALVLVHDSWAGDSAANLVDALAAAFPVPADGRLADRLEAVVAELGGHVYLLLDQFEEVFTYGGAVALADELAEVLRRERLRANVLVSLREDALSELDVFIGRIPDVFGNSVPLDRLDREAARAATVGPLGRWNELTSERAVDMEPELVEAVLDEVEFGRVVLGGVALGAAEAARGGIEAPYLQLVLQRLWEVEQARGSSVLRRATLEELGGAQAIVRAHLDRAVAALAPREQDAAARVFNHLVTPSGTKVAHAASDLAEYAGVREQDLLPTLASLAGDRIVRPIDGRYEIFHDVLADAVLAWRTRHEAERALEQERAEARRRHRRLVFGLVTAVAGLAATAALAVYALTQRDDAREQAARATARSLDAQAGPLVPVAPAEIDPELGLLLATEAARRSPTPEGLDVLRRALLASHLRGILPDQAVTAAAFAGQRVAVGGAPGTVTVYSARDPAHPRRLRLASAVTGIEPTADGGEILITQERGPASLFDAETGERLGEFGDAPTAAAVSPGGTLVVTAENGTAHVSSAPGGGEEATIEQSDRIEHVSFGSGGDLVVTTSGHLARVFEAKTGRALAEVDQGGVVTSAEVTPDGRTLVTTGRNRTARLWSLPGGAPAGELTGHRGQVTAGAISPDGKLLATTSTDGMGRVWDLRKKSLATDLEGHLNRATGAAFSRDGTALATWGDDGTVRIWNPISGDARAVLPVRGEAMTSASFDATGESVLTTSADGRARLWRPFDARLHVVAAVPKPRAAVLNRAGTVAVVVGPRGVVVVDSNDGKELAELPAGGATALAASADGSAVATARGMQVEIWRVADGKRIGTISSGAPATAIAFRPDGRSVAAGTRPGAVVFLDDAKVLQGPDAPVTSLAYSPSADRIAAGFRTGELAVWALPSGKRLYVRSEHGTAVKSVAFSSNGRRLVTAGADRQVLVLRAADGRAMRRLSGHYGAVEQAAFSPDGRWVVTAEPGVAGLFDLSNGQRLVFLGGHLRHVLAASFDAAGRRIATVGTDGTLQAYDCDVCAGAAELIKLGEARLAATGRTLTPAERRRYFGG